MFQKSEKGMSILNLASMVNSEKLKYGLTQAKNSKTVHSQFLTVYPRHDNILRRIDYIPDNI